MQTLTLAGLKAALLLAQTNGQQTLFALEETSEAGIEGALALLVPEGASTSVVLSTASADDMAAAVAAAHRWDGPGLLVFWNADRYEAAQRAVLETAVANAPEGVAVLVHGHDLVGTPLADLPDGHGAAWARCDLEPTPVLFRVEKTGDFKGELTAVLPTIPGDTDPYSFTVYAHVGQHSTGSKGWYNGTRKATPDEYAQLAQELERIGYLLDVRQRWTQGFDATRRAALMRLAA